MSRSSKLIEVDDQTNRLGIASVLPAATEGDDTVNITEGGEYSFDGLGGADVLDATAANAQVILNLTNVEAVSASAFDDVINLTDLTGVLNIDAGTGLDVVDFSNALLGVDVNIDGRFLNVESYIGSNHDDAFAITRTGSYSIDGGTGFNALTFGNTAFNLNLNVFDVSIDEATNIASITGSVANGGADNVEFTNIQALSFGSGDDYIVATTANDDLSGGEGNDFLFGGQGNDEFLGGGGNDELRGGQGSDIIDGGAGADIIYGARDSDTINGGNGQDILRGGIGDDIIHGDLGNDIINGGFGTNTLFGGDGADTFTFQNALAVDSVMDFTALDRINVHNLLNVVDYEQGDDLEVTWNNNFRFTSDVDNNSVLEVLLTEAGARITGTTAGWHGVATFEGVADLTIANLITSGQLVDQVDATNYFPLPF